MADGMPNQEYLDEAFARRKAIQNLRTARRYAQQACEDLYQNASGYAGEAESARDQIDMAIRILNGEPAE